MKLSILSHWSWLEKFVSHIVQTLNSSRSFLCCRQTQSMCSGVNLTPHLLHKGGSSPANKKLCVRAVCPNRNRYNFDKLSRLISSKNKGPRFGFTLFNIVSVCIHCSCQRSYTQCFTVNFVWSTMLPSCNWSSSMHCLALSPNDLYKRVGLVLTVSILWLGCLSFRRTFR